MPKILNGKEVAEKILASLPKMNGEELAIISVGHDEASQRYVRNKIRACEKKGLRGHHYQFDPEQVTRKNLEEFIISLQQTTNLAGIIVQQPYPEEFEGIEDFIQPGYDVDGLGFCNMGKTLAGKKPDFYPATPLGIIEILKHYNIPIEGKSVTIIGRSDIVGRPLAAMMDAENATVTLCHSKTVDLNIHTKTADIIVTAVGKPGFLTSKHLLPSYPCCPVYLGPVIIDVGTNICEGGKLCGDVDFESVSPLADKFTPVPGGVGPVTVAMLVRNAIWAVLRRRKEVQNEHTK